ncbi:hypothetical protein DFQ27_005179, partial [Actinomortierella ambigua]
KSSPDPATIKFDLDYNGPHARELVTRGHEAGVKVLISIGGWTGSETFSDVAKDAAARKRFINNALHFVRKEGYGMDGIDLDWEYPGRKGTDCNTVDKDDSANYLKLLRELRQALDEEFPDSYKLITAAVWVEPFAGEDGKPMASVDAYVPFFDYIMPMAYDLMGHWSKTTGPHSPLYTNPDAGYYTFMTAVGAWVGAGWPKDKLVVGVPFYGRSFTTVADKNHDWSRFMVANKTKVVPQGGPHDKYKPASECSKRGGFGGTWFYKELRQEILRDSPTTPVSGWARYKDFWSKTPFLINQAKNTMVSYEDPESLCTKVLVAKSEGIRGVMLWEITNDYNNELLTALNQIHSADVNCDAYWGSTDDDAAEETNKPRSKGKKPSTKRRKGKKPSAKRRKGKKPSAKRRKGKKPSAKRCKGKKPSTACSKDAC